METKLLVLYEQDYDLLSFYDTITENVLEEYFRNHVTERIANRSSKRKVEIVSIKHYPNGKQIAAKLRYLPHEETYNGQVMKWEEAFDDYFLSYHIVHLDQVITNI